MSLPAAPVSSQIVFPSTAASACINNDNHDVEFEEVEVLVDANGEEIAFSNEQDVTNVRFWLDFQALLRHRQRSGEQSGESESPVQQQSEEEAAEGQKLERIFGPSTAATSATSAASPPPYSSPSVIYSSELDFAHLFTSFENRKQLAAAGEMEPEDRMMLEQQKKQREEDAKANNPQREMEHRSQQQQQQLQQQNGEGEAEDAEQDEEDDDEVFAGEEGMQESMQSRDNSHFVREETEQREWKLQRIIARKTVAVDDDDDDDDADLYEDADAGCVVGRSVTSRRKKRREHVYHCVWLRHGGYTTWELKATLIEMGVKNLLDEFEAEAAKKATTAKSSTVRTDFKPPAQYSSIAGYRLNYTAPQDPTITFEPLAAHRKFFEDLFPNAEHLIKKKFRGMGALDVDRIINIAPEGPATRFIARYGKAGIRPMLLFHGSPAVASIMKDGLVVPGSSGVAVRNGQAYSNGVMSIYTATSPSTSKCYCSGSIYMFVCVGVADKNSGGVLHNGQSIVTFSDATDVVPVWLVRHVVKQFLQVPRRFYVLSEFERLAFLAETDGAAYTALEKTVDPAAAHLPVSAQRKVLRLKKRLLDYSLGRR